jgi:predicted transposase/invertase (TIGR01784 family)
MSKNQNEKTRTVLSFDYAMKKLLRQKSNYKILEGFLSELLSKDIVIKSILESESNQDKFEDKQTRVDILAEDINGELMLIEVQYQFEIDYLLRVLYGVSRNITDRLMRGESYGKVKKVYSINILYFNKFNNEDEYIYHGKTEFRGMHNDKILPLTKKEKELFKKETVGDLYPEYYLLDVTNFDNVAKSSLDEWIYYFKNSEIKETFTAKGMKEVKSHLDFEKLDKVERRKYEKAIDIKLGWQSSIDTAKIEGKAEGKAEGIAEGMKKGMEKGIEKGMKKGMEKGMKKGMEKGMEKGIEKVAQEAHKKGFPIETIQAITGLSKTQIEKIIS